MLMGLFYAMGIICHIWAVICILQILVMMQNPIFKRMGGTIELKPLFFLPYIGIIIFWCMFFTM